jgi:hypothetical protein
MDAPYRLFLSVGVAASLVIIILAIALAGGVGGGLEDWNVLAWLGQLEHGQRQGADLDAQLAATKRAVEAKDRIVNDLAAGRLTLIEAAAAFRAINRAQSEHGEDTPVHRLCPPDRAHENPAMGYEECLCWNVIDYVEHTSKGPPDRTAALRARLERELRDHLHRHGRVQLPPVLRIE